ncbi:MAG: hypothetical protein Hens3KO_08970 [Henriciella sp.]
MVSGYVTTDTVDDGIAWLRDQPADAPWFMWMAFNAQSDQSSRIPVKPIRARRDHAPLQAYAESAKVRLGPLPHSQPLQSSMNDRILFPIPNHHPERD